MTKPKAKPIQDTEEHVSSIPQFNEAIRLMKLGKLSHDQMVKFRDLLVANYDSGKITEKEQDVMEAILRRERNGRNKKKMTISDSLGPKEAKLYFLINKLEAERVEDTCIVKSNTPPATFHCTFGQECKMVRDVEADRYLIYIPEELPPTHQYTAHHFQKTALGQALELEELPAPKVLWHFRDINNSDFNRFFKASEESQIIVEEKEEPIIF